MFDLNKTETIGSSIEPETDNSLTAKLTKSPTTSGLTPSNPVIDDTKRKMLLQQIRDNQNLSMGFVGGLVAALIGASVWAVITALTNYQIGFMAIGVGFLVGYAIRRMGQGVDPIFGYFGAGLSFLGCVLGNLLTTCVIVSQQDGVALGEVLAGLNLSVAIDIMKFTFSPIDLLFYGLALYYGHKFSFRQLTPDELKSISKPASI